MSLPTTYLITALLVSGPWIYFTGRYRHQPPANPSAIRPYVSILLLLHTLYVLHGVIVSPPPNIFTSLRIPLNASTDRIREMLARYSGIDLAKGDSFPKPLELLLKRLSLFEHRSLYVRFGQHVLQSCEYCTSFDDFALYALAQSALSYIYETAVIGLVTVRGTHREWCRTMAIGVVVAAAVAEGYWISSIAIRVPRRGEDTRVVMWHDVLHQARQILFLLLPVIIHLLPGYPASSRNPIFALPGTINGAERLLSRIHLMKYARGAIMRTPSLREHASKWWDVEKREGEWVRGDESVRQIAQREGFGFTPSEGGQPEGPLTMNAQLAANGLLKDGLTVPT